MSVSGAWDGSDRWKIKWTYCQERIGMKVCVVRWMASCEHPLVFELQLRMKFDYGLAKSHCIHSIYLFSKVTENVNINDESLKI